MFFSTQLRRDLKEKGQAFVDAEYPPRAAFCVPIIVSPADAYDVSLRATPEMEAAGKEPGRNLADKLLNEPGMPARTCRSPELRPTKTFLAVLWSLYVLSKDPLLTTAYNMMKS